MIKARRRWWSAEVEAVLKPVLLNDLEQLREQVRAGIAEVWQLEGLHLLTRVEGKELVVCCGIGDGLSRLAPFIRAAAKKQGCETIRYHSQRPALARLLTGYGFSEVERVYQMKV